jgi:hypothetical protein
VEIKTEDVNEENINDSTKVITVKINVKKQLLIKKEKLQH